MFLPPTGLMRTEVKLLETNTQLTIGHVNEHGLPFLDLNLVSIFRFLGIGNVLHVRRSLMATCYNLRLKFCRYFRMFY